MTSAQATKKRIIKLLTLPDVTAWVGFADHPPFDRHVHLGYHLGVVFQGTQRFWHKGGQHYLTGQSIATINPDEVHDGHSVSEKGYHHGVFQFSSDTLAALFNDNLGRFFLQSTIENEPYSRRLANIFQTLSVGNPDPDQLALQTEAIQMLLGDLLELKEDSVNPKTSEATVLLSLKQFIKHRVLDDPQTPLPLSELTKRVDWNQYQLIRRFKKHFGITPYAYQLCLRLEQAKASLQRGKTIINIAHEQGFSDQSHFTRCFRRAYFSTPAQFQQQVQ